jgi:hypothetical protein
MGVVVLLLDRRRLAGWQCAVSAHWAIDFACQPPRDARTIRSHPIERLPMPEEPPFFPRGAVAFFAAMMVFYAAFWLFIMAIMVSRG